MKIYVIMNILLGNCMLLKTYINVFYATLLLCGMWEPQIEQPTFDQF